MKKNYWYKSIETTWNDYYSGITVETQNLSDATCFPLNPINKYLKKTDRYLELGCGTGRVFNHFFNLGYNVFGCDIIEDAINRIKKEKPTANVVVANITNLPYEDNYFDIITAYGPLCHLETDMEQGLREVKRALKPGGIFITSFYYKNLARLLINTYSILLRFKHSDKQKHFYCWTTKRKEWHHLLTLQGFENIEFFPVVFKSFIWKSIPLLRKNKKLHSQLARDSEKGYELIFAGHLLYAFFNRVIPWQTCGIICTVSQLTK